MNFVTLPDLLADIQIETASVPPALNDATARGVLWQAAPRRFLIDVPEVARYLVTDGRAITIEPKPRADETDVTRFLRMTPFAALLFQRGILAFHAAAAIPTSPPTPPLVGEGRRGEVGAVLIAGDSGAGKSTLLAALAQRGWTALADDLAVVEVDERGAIVVLPTFADVRLWQDTREKLSLRAKRSNPQLGDGDCFVAKNAPRNDTPQPLRAIFWLSVHNKDEIEIKAVEGAERFRALGTLTYNSHIADALFDRAVFLRKAAVLAQSVPLRRLRRPRGKWCAEELADRINKVWAGTSPAPTDPLLTTH